MQRLIGFAMACVLAGVSTAAFAQDGYVTGNVNLRAGPDIGYPAVDVIPVGSPVAARVVPRVTNGATCSGRRIAAG